MVTNANQTPPHPSSTPSPAGLGKGMSSQERASLGASRQSSMSSQMAAINAASEQDNSPSPLGGMSKGKLDIKEEKMDPDEMSSADKSEGNCGKNVNNDMGGVNIKSEIKQEPMDDSSEAGAVSGIKVKINISIKFFKNFLNHNN